MIKVKEGRQRRGIVLPLLALAVLLTGGCDGQRTTPLPTGVTAQPTPLPSPTATATPIPPTPTPPAPLAALVNGDYVFLADYEQRVAAYEQALLDRGLDPQGQDGQAALAEMRRQVLDSLVDTVIVRQQAGELGVVLTAEQVDAQMAADIKAGGGEAAFTAWLSATAQTRDDYQAGVTEALLWQRVADAIAGELPAAVEQVHVRTIVVDSREAAAQVQAELQAGADFAEVARRSSLDAASREDGGDLGWLARGLMDPELEAIAFSLEPGEIAGPLEIGPGFRFVQVTEREAGRAVPAEMQLELKRAALERWLEEQRRAARIERFVDTGGE